MWKSLAKLSAIKQYEDDVKEFIRRLKKYTDVQELTREMGLSNKVQLMNTPPTDRGIFIFFTSNLKRKYLEVAKND
ncbi:MAG: DUF4368 domain-containing protein [Huintestinicola sp.]